MKGRARKVFLSFLGKEAAALAARPLFQLLRLGVPLILFLAVLLWWRLATPVDGRQLLAAVSVCLYAAVVLAAPAAAAGALEDERRKGTLDLLLASPVAESRLPLVLAGARLLALGWVVVGALPLLVFPLYLGGVGAADLLLRLGAPLLIGTALSGAYGLSQAVAGRSPREVVIRGLVLVALTPLTMFSTFLPRVLLTGLTPILLVAWLDTPFQGVFSLGSAFFPAWALGLWVTGGAPPVAALVGAASAVLLASFYLRQALVGFPLWLRRCQESRGAAVGWAAAPLITGLPARKNILQWAAAKRLNPLPLLSRPVLLRAGGLLGRAYLRTGRNPFLYLEVLERRPAALRVRLAFAMFLFAMAVALRALQPSGGPAPAAWRAFAPLCLLLGGFLASSEASFLLPPRNPPAHLDLLLTSPLGGRSLVTAACSLAFLRLVPILGIFAAAGMIMSSDPAGVLAALALFASWSMLAAALGLWASLLLDGEALRCAAALGAFLALLGAAALLLAGPSLGGLHPVGAWITGRGTPAQAIVGGALAATAGVGLLAAFALSFRPLASRR